MSYESGRGWRNREELGQWGSLRRKGGEKKKDVSKGAEPGVRGFEEDSGEMDSLGERSMALYM